jgi:hypothetical protein
MNPHENNPFQNLAAGAPAQLYVVSPHGANAPRGKASMIYAGATVVAAVVVAVTVFVCFRRPTQVRVKVPPPPPKVVYKEVPVYRPPVAPPQPPPVVAKFENTPVPPPPPAPIPSEPEPGPYDGAWCHVGRRPLPAFTLKQAGRGTLGNYAPGNASGTYPFTAGPIVSDALIFSVRDELNQRIYFEMKFESDTLAKVVTWRRTEDVVADLNQVKVRHDLAPKQRLALQVALERELARAGKRISIGTFRRGKDPALESE